jgi:hypothetical protein
MKRYAEHYKRLIGYAASSVADDDDVDVDDVDVADEERLGALL